MKFSVPTNWQDDLLLKMRKDSVDEVFGKLAKDFIGGGRASFTLPRISKRKAASHIDTAHKNGLKFNYLLNATCLDNKELTSSGQRSIDRLLRWITGIGVDSVTVAMPYLLEMIKKRFPGLKVNVSTQAGVDGIERAKYWEGLGADEITLSFVDINRNFNLIRKIKKSTGCKIKVIANLECLYQCPFFKYHAALNSHASQSTHHLGGFMLDYCSLRCNYLRLLNPAELIRSPWIRPEDVKYYEDAGVDRIKLVNRAMTTDWLLTVINAYTDRNYDGNLLDLFSEPAKNIVFQKPGLFRKLRYFFRPALVNIFKLQRLRKLSVKRKVYINNKDLNGFIEYFLKEDCSLKTCRDCSYCESIAKKAVTIDPAYKEESLGLYRDCLDGLISGAMFKYIDFK